ncbi:HD domain-containing protein [archaeon]|nr:HD domain-containing protein [archaeon]MBT4648491.1 HD domain-containing protein [archaeon]MBT6821611.1 HD domain-containing protein [archaeon]MBT7392489.1 HD domain-containing protein [archaeon]
MKDLLKYYKDINKLKESERQGWVDRKIEPPRDTIASHSWGASLIGWLMAKKEGQDEEKIIKLLLMHDLIMAHIDDFVPDDENYTSKRDIENGLSEKLLGNIPKEIREEFMKLFLEYQKEETKESKLARECDKLDTLFQTVIYSEKKERNILKEFLPFYKKKFTSKTGKKLFAELEEYSENFA